MLVCLSGSIAVAADAARMVKGECGSNSPRISSRPGKRNGLEKPSGSWGFRFAAEFPDQENMGVGAESSAPPARAPNLTNSLLFKSEFPFNVVELVIDFSSPASMRANESV